MKKIFFCVITLFVILSFSAALKAEEKLHTAVFKDFALESGVTVKQLKICYRTFGTLNENKSNAVLFPTWFTGTSQELDALGYAGPGKMADSDRFFVIALDNPGNGVSSSPTNHGKQALPVLSMADLVKAQHLLVTERLGITKLHAVIGISMGAMQALQWLTAYPDMMDKVVAICGSPRLTSYDLLLWQGQLNIIAANRAAKKDKASAMKLIAPQHIILTRTPAFFATEVPADKTAAFLATVEKGLAVYDPDNWEWQLKSLMTHDITKSFGGSVEKAAAASKARLFVVVAPDDAMVYSKPVLEFAKLVKADKLVLSGKCGHFSFLCDKDEIAVKVRKFLGK